MSEVLNLCLVCNYQCDDPKRLLNACLILGVWCGHPQSLQTQALCRGQSSSK